jgi:O-glycosyl hydrolase
VDKTHWQAIGTIGVLMCFIVSCTGTATSTPIEPTDAEIPQMESPAPPADIPVNIWLTTPDQKQSLSPQPAIAFELGVSGSTMIYINENHIYQQMDGFGASMTDSSAWLIYTQLSESQREAVMSALFSREEGIGISVTRIPMGASDFVNGDAYTYDDMPPGQTDPELAHFSIDHDQAYIIPSLLDARKINPDLKIIASPWSPPAWMKDSDSLFSGRPLREYYPALAQYFVRFIQAYEAEGLPIYAITIQNEPYYEPYNYPGMRFDPKDAAEFVKDYLGPAFESASIEAKILIWDHNWDNWEYPLELLDDPQAEASVDGIAFHCYAGTVIAQGIVHDTYPEKELYFTECSGGTWVGGYAIGLRNDMKDLIVGATRNWAKTVIKWNLALDTEHNPHNGGCGTCDGLVTIDPSTESGFITNFDYYSIGHASKFVLPAAYRIASTTFYNSLESVAFKNPDGSKVLIVANVSASSSPKDFTVRWGNQSFSYSLSSGTAVTFTWQGESQITTLPSIPDDLITTRNNDSVILKWEFSPLADSYNIKRAEQAGGPYEVIASDITIPEYFDADITLHATYYYMVSAVNKLGESPDSTEAVSTP